MGRLAFISGVGGLELSDRERAFFGESCPLGLILFARNIADGAQVKRLISEVREAVGVDEFYVLIDQEGGRVQRMEPPLFPSLPAASRYGQLYQQDPELALAYAFEIGKFMGGQLRSYGINVNCTPVLDVHVDGADEIIGNRSFGSSPPQIAALGRAHSEGHMAGGVLPVIKHIPGHGRALCDSHLALPIIEATRSELIEIDFEPFRQLNDMPLAMTAHVILKAYEKEAPISISRTAINEIIRGEIGFDGFLMCDDVSMQALDGSIGERTASVLAAGCDGALHCNGVFEEMIEVAKNSVRLEGESAHRFKRSFEFIQRSDAGDEKMALSLLGEDWAMGSV